MERGVKVDFKDFSLELEGGRAINFILWEEKVWWRRCGVSWAC